MPSQKYSSKVSMRVCLRKISQKSNNKTSAYIEYRVRFKHRHYCAKKMCNIKHWIQGKKKQAHCYVFKFHAEFVVFLCFILIGSIKINFIMASSKKLFSFWFCCLFPHISYPQHTICVHFMSMVVCLSYQFFKHSFFISLEIKCVVKILTYFQFSYLFADECLSHHVQCAWPN